MLFLSWACRWLWRRCGPATMVARCNEWWQAPLGHVGACIWASRVPRRPHAGRLLDLHRISISSKSFSLFPTISLLKSLLKRLDFRILEFWVVEYYIDIRTIWNMSSCLPDGVVIRTTLVHAGACVWASHVADATPRAATAQVGEAANHQRVTMTLWRCHNLQTSNPQISESQNLKFQNSKNPNFFPKKTTTKLQRYEFL